MIVKALKNAASDFLFEAALALKRATIEEYEAAVIQRAAVDLQDKSKPSPGHGEDQQQRIAGISRPAFDDKELVMNPAIYGNTHAVQVEDLNQEWTRFKESGHAKK